MIFFIKITIANKILQNYYINYEYSFNNNQKKGIDRMIFFRKYLEKLEVIKITMKEGV